MVTDWRETWALMVRICREKEDGLDFCQRMDALTPSRRAAILAADVEVQKADAFREILIQAGILDATLPVPDGGAADGE